MSAEKSDRAGKARLWRDRSGGCNGASKERDLELVNGYCSQSLSEGEFAELEQRLRQSSEVRQLLVEYRAVESALPSVFAYSGSQSAITTSAATKGLLRRLRMEVLAMSVVISLLVGVIVFLWSGNSASVESENTPHVAMVTQAIGAYTPDDIAIRPGQQIVSGQIALDCGVICLDFVSGARIVIEGPARLEVMNDMHMVLGRGVISATIPKSATGFMVETKTANVLDLGTAFGVSVEEDGTTGVCVFQGKVSVDRNEAVSSAPTLVREGQAIRTLEGSNVITWKEYDVTAFENLWPVNLGVLQTTGAIRFVSPGPDFLPGQLEDNKHIIVFPERRDVELAEPLHVDITDPGEYIYIPNKEKETIKAGRRLSSFLLQLHVRDRGKDNRTKVQAIGQITFATPIAGVIATGSLLDESEVIFGNSKVSYEVPRGTEPRIEGSNRRTIYDRIILAADQRTLILDLQVAPKKLDQLRILVEAESL